jgi:hypothetical protein
MPGTYGRITGGAMRSSSRTAADRADLLRLRGLAAILVIMIALTAGWSLLSLAISNRRQLAAFTTLSVGPGRGDLANFTVGPKWSVVPSETDPRLNYLLRRGDVDLTVSYITLVGRAQTAHLWEGMHQIIQITHPGMRLGPATTFTTLQGRSGISGSVTGAGNVGTATVVRDPGGTFAVEMLVTGPRHESRLNLLAADRVLRSLRMPAGRS